MNVKLQCSCGAVKGVAINISSETGNRVVCCCDDCQKFSAHLRRESDMLDPFGGTDIFQISQSQVKIEQGVEHLRCLKLTQKGLFRWYTECCKTPVGNTLSAGFPLIGLIHNFMSITDDRDDVLGAVRAYMQTKHAHGVPSYPTSSQKFPLGVTLRMIRKSLLWKFRGMNRPSVFYTETGDPIVEPIVLDSL